ncbi:hypothetical protein, partial [Alistipes putredinis]|uniref:hypothetical protein n=1 Tax=Alistipes putredinis TaxID=28117 RepID=UPI003AB7FB2C
LRHNHEQMDELTGRYYDPSMFVDYKADVEKPLPMIYQSGYLTIISFHVPLSDGRSIESEECLFAARNRVRHAPFP